MKACVIRQAKDLVLADVPDPTPGPREVLLRLGAGGICGSDLHYFAEGGVGDFKVREPLILGHEVAGEVVRLGPEVTKLRVGDRVAVNPSRTCGCCRQCRAGRRNLCEDIRFFGSAARFPHVSGIFSDYFIAPEENCHPIPRELSFPAAACAEPLAVVLHAAAQAGSLLSRNVAIIGSGPIGVLVAAVARLGGAQRICVIDILDAPLKIALAMGATETVNAAAQLERITEYAAKHGTFDVVFEASGSPAGLANALGLVAAGGTLVQIGILASGNSAAPLNRVITKELNIKGSFRFDTEYGDAVNILAQGGIDVTPMLTHEFPFAELQAAFRTAADRREAMKVSLRST